jgi:hypothetical protein
MTRGQGLEGREIWFRRWGWRYWPCHWKGWLLLAVTAPATVAAAWLVREIMPRPAPVWLVLLGVAPAMAPFLWLWWITERHCAPRP